MGNKSLHNNISGNSWVRWMSAFFLGLVVVLGQCLGAESSTYVPNFCYCDLNNHLVDVRKALINDEVPPAIPSADDMTTPASTGNDAASESSDTSGNSDPASDGTDATSGGTDASSGGADTTSGGSDATSGGADATSGGADSTSDGADSTSGGSDATSGGSDATSGSDATTSGNSGAGSGGNSGSNSDASATTASATAGSGSDNSLTSSSASNTASGTNTDSISTDSSSDLSSPSGSDSDSTGNSGATTTAPSSGGNGGNANTVSSDAGTDGTTTTASDGNSNAMATSDGTTVSDGSTGGSGNPDCGTGNGNGNGNNAPDCDTESTGTSTEATTAAARRKRQADLDDYNQNQAIENMAAVLKAPPIAYYGPRAKREAIDFGSPLVSQQDPLFSFITQQVVYSGLKTASDQGVVYDTNGNAKNCSCKDGSVVRMKLCLLNLKYESALGNERSELHKQISNELLFPLTGALYKGLVGEGGVRFFRRVTIQSYEKRDEDSTFILLEVTLSTRLYQAEYHVKNALEPSIRSGEIGSYKTDHEICLITEDITPPEPVELSPVWWLRYICLPIAIGVIALLVMFTCIGKRDAYYARFW